MDQDPKKEKGSRLYTLLKVLFCIVAFVLVIFTILGNMGGNGDFQKITVEEFAGESTGSKAVVKKLNGLTYFPTISVDFEDMDFFRDPASEIAVAHIDRAQFAVGFWDVARHTGKMKALNVQGIHAIPGAIFAKGISLKYFSIIDITDTQAKLEGRGFIGDTPLLFTMDMSVEGKGRARRYTFDPRRNISFELGDIKMTAILQNALNPYISLQELKITQGGKEAAAGRLDISNRRQREVSLTGELKIGGQGTVLKPDLILDLMAGTVAGSIAGENVRRQDLAENSPFDDFLEQLIADLGGAETDAKTLDEFFAAQDITLDLKGDVAYQGKLRFENNTLALP
jgi:hypothetical protein